MAGIGESWVENKAGRTPGKALADAEVTILKFRVETTTRPMFPSQGWISFSKYISKNYLIEV